MASIMRRMNIMSRCESIYRTESVGVPDICGAHHSFILAITNNPGMSQEEIARHICLNKSTVARTLLYLEEHGYVSRKTDPSDKRQIRVFPTEKMLEIYPRVKESTIMWNEKLRLGIDGESLRIFDDVLSKMTETAKSLAGFSEDKRAK